VAAAEGVLGVMRIPFAEESVNIKMVLDMSAEYEVPCYLALGYPQEGVRGARQHVINVDDRISFNRWGNRTD
jgi:hypothetical protein